MRPESGPPSHSTERAPPRRVPWQVKVALTALEALARLSIPASVLLLARGSTLIAAAASAVALIATIARGFATSYALERALRVTFDEVLRAALRLALVDLRAERKIGLLAEAAREAAAYESTIVPLIGAHALAIVLTWGALVAVLGPLWAGALVLAAAPLLAALAFGARRIRAEQEAAWGVFTELAIDLRVLVEACVELRAHDRERSFSRGLAERARAFAAAERRANVWSAASTAVPSALVLVSSTTPLGPKIAALVGDATGRRAAEIAITSAAALYFALGLGKLLESRARYAPFRETLRAFLGSAAKASPEGVDAGDGVGADATPERDEAATDGSAKISEKIGKTSAQTKPGSGSARGDGDGSLVGATIAFRAVSCRHPNAPRATPERVSFTWEAGRGLVLSGENGAGKSTLVMALLGLLPANEGAIEIDGAALDEARARAVRERTAYLAQAPFVEPGASVAWHMRLFAREAVSDARIDAALRRAGLWPILEEHARREGARGISPREVPAGELSGGERQRMHIARVLAQEAELIVLDEPEAGLDREARAQMAQLFEELAASLRVLVIAHDPTIVPASFARVELQPQARGAPRQAKRQVPSTDADVAQ
ncbi:MAG: ATP-binding cassette domain-containing protein [Polyangiaceae bacterium]